MEAKILPLILSPLQIIRSYHNSLYPHHLFFLKYYIFLYVSKLFTHDQNKHNLSIYFTKYVTILAKSFILAYAPRFLKAVFTLIFSLYLKVELHSSYSYMRTKRGVQNDRITNCIR